MIQLPYGNTTIPFDETNAVVLRSRIDELQSTRDGADIVRNAMAHPYGGESLETLARGKRTCTIIVSDHTRPVPSKAILPAMLTALRRENPGIEITLLVATGFHRGTTQAELVSKLGEEIANNERIVVHECENAQSNVFLGMLPSGAPLVIDREAAKTELLVAEGFIEPHFFAGFSGGRKSILPGVCDRKTVLGNHCSRFIDSPFARTGVLERNPIHTDMLAAMRMAKLRYIVNVVIDEGKHVVAAFAGEPEQAHAAGCAFLKPYCATPCKRADIVIVTNGGAPLDQNLYQCVKGLTAAEAASRPGGVLILVAACADGTGGEGFYHALASCESASSLYASIMATPQDETLPDQWESQILARVLLHRTVVVVTDPALERVVTEMKMRYASSLTVALALARSLVGNDARVSVIPNGVSVIIEPQD